MYCGDETGSFVGEIGSHVSRFGYGGEDSPKFVVPSYVVEQPQQQQGADDATDQNKSKNRNKTLLRRAPSCYNYDSQKTYRTPMRMVEVPPDFHDEQAIVDPTRYLQQGDSFHDWEAVEALWQSAFDTMRVTDPYKHTSGRRQMPPSVSASGVQSTTVVSSAALGEGKCVHPLLAVAPGCTHRAGKSNGGDAAAHRRELVELTELMMEKLDCQALFIAPAPMLAAFSHGRQTALVVDIGASGCRVTPVVDGLLLKQAQRRNGRGGDWMANVQWHALLQEKTLLRPRYQVKGIRTTTTIENSNAAAPSPPPPSGRGIFHRWAMHDLMYEFRTSSHVQLQTWWYDPSVPFLYDPPTSFSSSSTSLLGGGGNTVSALSSSILQMDAAAATTTTSGAVPGASSETTYELPDGTLIDLTTRVGKDLCRIPELLFADKLPFLSSSSDMFPEERLRELQQEHASLTDLSLPSLIHASLSAVGDADARKDLAGSILLTGGSSLFRNFEQRLSYEVPRLVSSAYKTKILASQRVVHNSLERSCSSWIGGSILTSLGSFQQLWLSKAEYEEYGATLAVQRFP